MLNASYQKYVETYNRTNSEYLNLENQNNAFLSNYNALEATYNQLSSYYQQLSSDLTQTTGMLNTKETELSELQNNVTVLKNSYDDLYQQYEALSNASIQFCNRYNATDGVFILNYTMTVGTIGLTTTYLANMTIYNALTAANVTVELYGTGGTVNFTYQIPEGTIVHKAESWQGGIFGQNYGSILIENVTRYTP